MCIHAYLLLIWHAHAYVQQQQQHYTQLPYRIIGISHLTIFNGITARAHNMSHPHLVLSLLLCFSLGSWTVQSRTAKRSDVYIAGFFPYGDGVENSYTGRGVMPSVKLALGHVNEHPQILTNYRLHMWWNDTQV